MARLHGYLNDSGYYIKHSFLADRRLHHVVYQVSHEAEEILLGQGLKDGDLLPDDIFYSLRETGRSLPIDKASTAYRLSVSNHRIPAQSPLITG